MNKHLLGNFWIALFLVGCKPTINDSNKPVTPTPENCPDKNGIHPFSGGDGNSDSPYQICDAEDFNSIGLDYLENHFEVVRDIDFDGQEVTPVGTDSLAFSGVFDGKSFTLSNFLITSTAERTGLFRSLSATGQVKSLRVTNASVVGTSYVGVVAGYSHGVISEVVVQDSDVEGTGDYVGGVAGYTDGNTTALLYKTYFSGNVFGANHVGGLIGRSYFGRIQLSLSEANVVASADKAGGIVGSIHDNNCEQGVDFSNSISKATVTGVNFVGGVIGHAAPSGACVFYVLSDAVVTASGNDVGGFAGHFDNGMVEKLISRSVVNAAGNYRGAVHGGRDSPGSTHALYVDLNRSQMLFGLGASTPTTGSNSTITVVNSDGLSPDYFKTITNAPWTFFDFVGSSADGTNDHWKAIDGDYPTLTWLWELDQNASE